MHSGVRAALLLHTKASALYLDRSISGSEKNNKLKKMKNGAFPFGTVKREDRRARTALRTVWQGAQKLLLISRRAIRDRSIDPGKGVKNQQLRRLWEIIFLVKPTFFG